MPLNQPFPLPHVLYQEPTQRGTFLDVFLLYKNTYITAEELAKVNPGYLKYRLNQAKLPLDFHNTKQASSIERPKILVQDEPELFVAAEKLLKSRCTVKPLVELYEERQIFIFNQSPSMLPRYVNFSLVKDLYPDEISKLSKDERAATPILNEFHRMQLGMESRINRPRVPTSIKHVQTILLRLNEPDSIAYHYQNWPPILVRGDHPVFDNGAQKNSSPITAGKIASDTGKIFILEHSNFEFVDRQNYMEAQIKGERVARPKYKELSTVQYKALKSMEDRLKEHLVSLGCFNKDWALETSYEGLFRVGNDEDLLWTQKLLESQKKLIGLVGESKHHDYICSSRQPEGVGIVTVTEDYDDRGFAEFVEALPRGDLEDIENSRNEFHSTDHNSISTSAAMVSRTIHGPSNRHPDHRPSREKQGGKIGHSISSSPDTERLAELSTGLLQVRKRKREETPVDQQPDDSLAEGVPETLRQPKRRLLDNRARGASRL